MENIKNSDELIWFQLNQTTRRRQQQLSRMKPGNFDEGGERVDVNNKWC
jgi:hypothetical protein